MQEEHQETTIDAPDAPDADDSALADAVDQQAAASSGADAEQAPEVPDGASAAIARAEEHIAKLNMEKEREAAKRAM